MMLFDPRLRMEFLFNTTNGCASPCSSLLLETEVQLQELRFVHRVRVNVKEMKKIKKIYIYIYIYIHSRVFVRYVTFACFGPLGSHSCCWCCLVCIEINLRSTADLWVSA